MAAETHSLELFKLITDKTRRENLQVGTQPHLYQSLTLCVFEDSTREAILQDSTNSPRTSDRPLRQDKPYLVEPGCLEPVVVFLAVRMCTLRDIKVSQRDNLVSFVLNQPRILGRTYIKLTFRVQD
jgi:hypothetical protein